MILRKAEPKDKQLFLTMADEFYHLPAVLHEVDPSYFASTFHCIMHGSPYAALYIAEENETPVGYLLLSLTWSNEAGGLTVWLEEIYIREAFRQNGYGTQMLHFVKETYPDAKRFRLEISPENERAKKLYQTHGFTVLDYQQMVCEESL